MLKDLPLRRGRRIITALVAEGEHECQDFKYAVSDAHKIARSVSAFANAGGGRLLIGVKDNGVIAGVRTEEDVYVVEQAARRYCDPPQQVEFTAYSVDTGVTVIVASIARAAERPVAVTENDGSARVYFRVADENIVAHPLMVRAWREAGGVAFSLDATAAAMLRLTDEAGAAGVDPERVPVALGISRRASDSLITAMTAAGVLSFSYTGSAWRVIRNL